MPRKRSRRTTVQSDPRVTGGRYLSGYWRQEYTVTAMETRNGILWLTCQWHAWTPASDPRVSRQWAEPGSERVTRHCTPWDARRDAIIDIPTCMHGIPSSYPVPRSF
jgi:hypothetical protein